MSEKSQIIKNVPIFNNLDNSIIDKICLIGSVHKYSRDELILLEEDSKSSLFIILSGKVKVTRTRADGKEVILSIFSKSDFFGEISVIDGTTASASVFALEDSEIFIIQREKFIDLLKDHWEVSFALLIELSKRLRAADMQIQSLSTKDSEGKVASVLLQLAQQNGQLHEGIMEIDELPIHQELASMADSTIEVISKTLQSFAQKGLVGIHGSKLRILDFEKFRSTYSHI